MKVSLGRLTVFLATLASQCAAAPSASRQARNSITYDAAGLDGQSFDFVVVGGGLTGLVTASRLSENADISVLVVEAGEDTRQDTTITSLHEYGRAFGNPYYDWSPRTEAQALSNGKRYKMIQGKGLGGSSSINGAAFTLPPASQIDAMDGLLGGNTGWTFDKLYAYVRKYQHYHGPPQRAAEMGATANMSAHGNDGPIDIGFWGTLKARVHEVLFIRAQKEALHAPKIDDLGAGQSGGVGYIANTALPGDGDDRTRVSSADGYLHGNVTERVNLTILLNTRAVKALYSSDEDNHIQASSVQIQQAADGPTYNINARWVVVAAGALRTPLFLQHSGIGDNTLLRSLGIPTKVNLPGVGKNLCEQQLNNIAGSPPSIDLGYTSPPSVIAMNTVEQLLVNASDVRGLIESSIDAWAQEAVSSGASASKTGLLRQYRTMIDGIFDQAWPIAETFFIPTPDTIMLQVWALLSFSRGYVHARSASTWDEPVLDPRYWSASIDMDMQVAANRGARKVIQTEAMRAMMSGGEVVPGFDPSHGGIPQPNAGTPNNHYGSYARWRAYILDHFDSVNHPLGTAAMLPLKEGGVVDQNLRVYGTSNLYIVDASVLPMQQSTHLSGVLYAVAERASDILTQAYKCAHSPSCELDS